MPELAAPGARIVRPQAWPLAVVVAGYAIVLALIFAGAARIGDPFVAWLGVAIALTLVPIVDWYRHTVIVDAEGFTDVTFLARRRVPFEQVAGFGTWTSVSYKSGRWRWLSIVDAEGHRIDVSVTACRPDDVRDIFETLAARCPRAGQLVMRAPRMTRAAVGAVTIAVLVSVLSLLILGVTIPRTLGAERLFGWAAAAGLASAVVFARAAARRIMPDAAMTLALCVAYTSMVAVPAGALLDNVRWAGPFRHARMTVLSRRAYVDAGRTKYTAELGFDGVRKRVSPPASAWPVLTPGASFDACLRDGALGYLTIVSATHACPR